MSSFSLTFQYHTPICVYFYSIAPHYKTTIEIKHLVNNKNNQRRKCKNILIKISRGLVIDQNACVSFLKNLSINELINELEYAHSTKNFTLEQLVMNEYYQKQQ